MLSSAQRSSTPSSQQHSQGRTLATRPAGDSAVQFVDQRPEAAVQARLAGLGQSSQQTGQLQALQTKADRALATSAKPVAQLRNYKQACGLGDLTENGTSTGVGFPAAGKVYQTPVLASADRNEALVKASEYQAGVGGETEGYRYTDKPSKFNIPQVRSLDPFVLRARTSFGGKTLNLDYQNYYRWTGYVVRIEDSETGVTSGMAVRGNLAATATKGVPTGYSNQHALTEGSALTGLTTPTSGATRDKNEESLDAMTKIAGEGARWVAVRRHAGKLADGSFFVTRTNKDPDPAVVGVSFKNLWLSWASTFDKAYNIQDATVVNALKTAAGSFHFTPWTGKLSEVGSADYDLDNSRSHTA